MGKVSLTVKQIKNLGLWNQVCEYKNWSPYILNEGRIDENDIVEFDDEFKQVESNTENCPDCKEDLYSGWSPMTLFNSNGDDITVEIEVKWCEKCNKVVEADWT